MKKIKTLKKNYEFKNVITKGKFYLGNQIIIYITKNNKNANVIGIAVSSKICNAVTRNKIKRKIRENYRLINNKLKKGYNIVFVWNKNKNVEAIDYHTIEKDMNNIFLKAGLMENA